MGKKKTEITQLKETIDNIIKDIRQNEFVSIQNDIKRKNNFLENQKEVKGLQENYELFFTETNNLSAIENNLNTLEKDNFSVINDVDILTKYDTDYSGPDYKEEFEKFEKKFDDTKKNLERYKTDIINFTTNKINTFKDYIKTQYATKISSMQDEKRASIVKGFEETIIPNEESNLNDLLNRKKKSLLDNKVKLSSNIINYYDYANQYKKNYDKRRADKNTISNICTDARNYMKNNKLLFTKNINDVKSFDFCNFSEL